MKQSVTSIAAVLSCTLALFWQVSPAASAECEVSAYDAYLLAQQRVFSEGGHKLQFHCGRGTYIRFRADPDRGLVCSGTVPEQSSEHLKYSGHFFTTPGASIGLANSWKVSGFKVAGGEFVKNRFTARDVLILAIFKVSGGASNFEHEVRSIILKKPDGDCSKALDEAFDWSN